MADHAGTHSVRLHNLPIYDAPSEPTFLVPLSPTTLELYIRQLRLASTTSANKVEHVSQSYLNAFLRGERKVEGEPGIFGRPHCLMLDRSFYIMRRYRQADPCQGGTTDAFSLVVRGHVPFTSLIL